LKGSRAGARAGAAPSWTSSSLSARRPSGQRCDRDLIVLHGNFRSVAPGSGQPARPGGNVSLDR
jgi:hypothetical protein